MERRKFLKLGAGGFFGALLSRYALADATSLPASAPARPAPKAKSIVLLWMNGGPSHLETWDPKPGHANGGPTKAIRTALPGLSIAEHMPHLAAFASKLAVLRGMTSKEGNHQRAQYLMHTGYAPTPTVTHPSLGGWISKELGAPPNGLPAFVSLGGPSFGAGFLGVQNGPFVVQRAGSAPDNTHPETDDARFSRRQALLARAEQRFAQQSGSPMVDDRRAVYARATALMQSKNLSDFDLTAEPQAVRDAYGDTDFGRGCLVARRLVASGVRFVEVVQDGWDTHQNNFERTKNQLGIVDPAMAALLKDLDQRGLLASTLVVWLGDFGRTPRINGSDGRDHWPQAWSCALAGAGIKPGVVGATDAGGEKVVGKSFGVPDLLATCAKLAGLDPSKEVLSPIGRPIAVTDGGTPIAEVLA